MFLAQGILGKNCWLPILTVPAASCPCLRYSAIGPCYFLKECSALSSALSYIVSVRKGHEHFHFSSSPLILLSLIATVLGSVDTVWILEGPSQDVWW